MSPGHITKTELLDALQELVAYFGNRHGRVDSLGSRPHARAMGLLARAGRLRIVSRHDARYVVGRWRR